MVFECYFFNHAAPALYRLGLHYIVLLEMMMNEEPLSVTMAVASPLVLPDPFNGEGSWEQWSYHIANVTAVNDWGNEAKLKWLKLRLTGRAQIAFQQAVQADYDEAIAALKERFEPASRKHRYQAELQTRRRRKDENWADFAEDLKSLADKAYPELHVEARERLALNHYLTQPDPTCLGEDSSYEQTMAHLRG